MVKPIRVAELQARVHALLRRSYPSRHESELVFGDYKFSTANRTVHVKGVPAELGHREFDLALFLFQNIGRLLSREHLREAVWGIGNQTPSRSLDTHVSRLRVKLDLVPSNGLLLSAVYGLGYRLETLDTELLSPFPAAPPMRRLHLTPPHPGRRPAPAIRNERRTTVARPGRSTAVLLLRRRCARGG
jgi:DNA-binding winged helix-turn-helix (wHTH) protein